MQINFVRRIDELGRIVIPKEIRGKLKIESGELLDLNITDDSLVIKKANEIINNHYVKLLIEMINCFSNIDIIITQKEKIEIVSKKLDNNLVGKEVSESLKEILQERKTKDISNGINIINDYRLEGHIIIKTIIKNSDVLGLVIIKDNKNLENINEFLKIFIDLLTM